MTDPKIGYPCDVCVEDCEEFVIPAMQSEYCGNGVTVELAEIKRIFFADHDPDNPGEALGGPTDWTSAAAWETALHQTTAGKVRSLFGIGDVPEPEDTTITVHDNIEVVIDRKRRVNFSVIDVNTVNYAMMKKLQCGWSGRIWYESRGGYLYGGEQGIGVTIKPPTDPHNRGADSYKMINMTAIWNALCSPDRIASPFAGGAAEPGP